VVTLPEGVDVSDVSTYVGRAFVAVRVGARPVAFWRWSWIRRRLVAWRTPRWASGWSPAWSLPIADDAHRSARWWRSGDLTGLTSIAQWAGPLAGGALAAAGLLVLLLGGAR
jgi:hypothetical protein